MRTVFVRIGAFFASLMFMLAGVGQSVVGYTGGTPLKTAKRDYCFDNSGLLIGGYYGGRGLARYAAEAGLDFVIDNSVGTEMLDEYYKENVGVIAAGYNLPSNYATVSEANLSRWKNFDVSAYKDHPALWGDDLIDEPCAQSYGALAECLNSYHSKVPGKLALVNLFPNYADEEQLGEVSDLTFGNKLPLLFTDQMDAQCVQYKMYVSDYINTLPTDYISVDIYPYSATADVMGNEIKSTNNAYLRNLDILAEACRETGKDLWVITQAAGQTQYGKKGESHPRWCETIPDISQQMYACLAFGTKAVIHAEFASKGWWDAPSHMIGPDGSPTLTYYAVKAVNGYVKVFAQVYGNYDYSSTYMINRAMIAGRNRGGLNCTKAEDIAPIRSSNGLLVGVFNGKTADDGRAYVVTNMQELNKNQGASFTYKVPAGKEATVYKKGTATLYGEKTKLNISLDAGEGVFITVR